ncbi:hypothetical protein DEO72_LG6g1326 [Vigna unguiculata]|uniref:Uncharacterized protein n=1 Tax=Vigna unguiculata TaxID=3917 RepID=A0A4D6M5G8_VIGUN|nr:hypothetical protein DEO72_LG6g1326 [Vigna unguiculata]
MPFRAQLEECYVLNPYLDSTQGIHSELNSRNPAILPLKHHQKSRRSRLQSAKHLRTLQTQQPPPGGTTRIARRQCSRNPLFLSLSPDRLTLAARRHELPVPPALTLSPGGLHIVATRHDNNYAIAILIRLKHHSDFPYYIATIPGYH